MHFTLFIWLHWVLDVAHKLIAQQHVGSCGILVPWPETEPVSPALEGRFLTIPQENPQGWAYFDSIQNLVFTYDQQIWIFY